MTYIKQIVSTCSIVVIDIFFVDFRSLLLVTFINLFLTQRGNLKIQSHLIFLKVVNFLLEAYNLVDVLLNSFKDFLLFKTLMRFLIDCIYFHKEVDTFNCFGILIFQTETLSPLLESCRVLIVQLMVMRNSRILLIRLTSIILESIFKLGVTFRWWVIFHVINCASGRINFAMAHSSNAFFRRHFNKEVSICS